MYFIDKSGKIIVNPIIVNCDPISILYVNIYVCESINCKLGEISNFTNQLIDRHNSKPILSVPRYGAKQLLPPLPLSSEPSHSHCDTLQHLVIKH